MLDQYVRGLIPAIRNILESSDLSTISAKGVRKSLVSRGEDEATIKAHRAQIDDEISTIYDALTSAAPPSPPSSPDLPLQPKAEPGSSQPQPLAPRAGATQVKRESKPSIPSNAIHGTGNGETDEEMARRLQMEYDSVHGADSNAASSSSRPRRANAAPPKKKKKVSKKRVSRDTVDDDDDEGGERKKKRAAPDNNFNKELILSDSLAALVGSPRMSRPQVVKHIWDYVKGRNLQDEKDRRYILCDEKLNAVFHTERLHMFTMNKLLVPHVRNPDEVIMKDEVKGESAPVAPVIAQAVGTAMEAQALDTVTGANGSTSGGGGALINQDESEEASEEASEEEDDSDDEDY